MARNKLTDLNNHLFAQIERLGDEDLSEDKLKLECDRAKSIALIGDKIINNAKLVLDASKFKYNNLPKDQGLPEMLNDKNILE